MGSVLAPFYSQGFLHEEGRGFESRRFLLVGGIQEIPRRFRPYSVFMKPLKISTQRVVVQTTFRPLLQPSGTQTSARAPFFNCGFILAFLAMNTVPSAGFFSGFPLTSNRVKMLSSRIRISSIRMESYDYDVIIIGR